MDKIKNNNKLLTILLSISILLTPIWRYFNLLSTGVGLEALLTVFSIIIAFLLYISKNNQLNGNFLKSRRFFLLLGIHAILITIFYDIFIYNGSAVSINSTIYMILNIILIWLLINETFNKRTVFSVYSIFVWIIIFVYYFQWILSFFNIYFSFGLPFCTYSSGWQLNREYFGMSPRPLAFFSEKSHLCQYLIAYIPVCLFGKSKLNIKHYFLKSIIVSFTILTTLSGNGFVTVFLVWSIYLLIGGKQHSKNRIIITIIGLFVLFFIFLMVSRIPSISDMLSILFTSDNSHISSKADYRIYRGFDVFLKYPISAKVFGVGNYMAAPYAASHNIVSQYDLSYASYEYFSALFQLLLYFGIIGFALFTIHIIKMFKGQGKLKKALIILMIALWCSTEMIFSSFHIFFMLLILSSNLNSEISIGDKK